MCVRLTPAPDAPLRYLLKLLTGGSLPESEAAFTAALALYFPRVWDIKHIMHKINLHGGLSKARVRPRPLRMCMRQGTLRQAWEQTSAVAC